MSKFWTWFKGFFTSEKKAQIAHVIEEVQSIVEKAMPVVVLIDEKLKPLVETNVKFKDVYAFLKDCGLHADEAFNLAGALIKLPTPDMLANIAVLLLQNQAVVAASLSTLKLAIELAYSIYKSTKHETTASNDARENTVA